MDNYYLVEMTDREAAKFNTPKRMLFGGRGVYSLSRHLTLLSQCKMMCKIGVERGLVKTMEMIKDRQHKGVFSVDLSEWTLIEPEHYYKFDINGDHIGRS